MNSIYYLLPFIAGAALGAQVAINGKLLSGLASPLLTSTVSFAIGTIGLSMAYLIAVKLGMQNVPSIHQILQTTWWMWTGGLLGAFYIFTTIIASPKIGFANLFSLVVAGQIIFALIVDHFGILGTVHTVNAARILGVAFLILGVYTIQTH
ncbi:DMT family transporter|uniref:Transporter family-2 protein n=1 Tax=Dendrosporobacter quercicolus TaxID=146817 RepID=A0A1G9NNI7_9FIRM|nr:DMT family transporter [Dendrosporobacter quercicolus]NSL47402.1 DMT family transporter [Dendrosporobacter quercicolus DSM 1736]SDL88152.1 transporter family-2 protein [Dendrosporobacter quercicolus]